MRTDDPPQYFFNFELNNLKNRAGVPRTLSSDLKAAGVSDLVKLVTVPTGFNEIMVRVENLGDYLSNIAQTQTIDLQAVASALWSSANGPNAPDFTVEFEEMDLSFNMPLKDMQERKIKWKTMDDNIIGFNDQKIKHDTILSEISLEPQRIRVFNAKFMATPKFLQE